jgi:hypothetical protein
MKMRFSFLHDRAKRNVGWRMSQPHPPTAPPRGRDPPTLCQVMDNFHQVIFGNAVRVGDVGDGDEPVI